MVKTLSIIFLIFTSTILFIYYQETSICRSPLTYDIGSIDNRFGISKDKFLTTIKEAENIWESNTNKNLFDYKPSGKLKINLVFDERQKETIEANQSKQQIGETRGEYDALLSQYNSLESSYKSDLMNYESSVNIFEDRLDEYNKEVARVNSKGGATPKEYQDLKKEKEYLETRKSELDNYREDLNNRAAKLNSLGDQVNELARKLNINVDIHNQRFGEAREFDQGEYKNKTINIYEFEGISDLRLVTAHELGHAIGLDHVINPKSIMYYLMDEQDLNNPALSKEDKEAFTKFCKFNPFLPFQRILQFQY